MGNGIVGVHQVEAVPLNDLIDFGGQGQCIRRELEERVGHDIDQVKLDRRRPAGPGFGSWAAIAVRRLMPCRRPLGFSSESHRLASSIWSIHSLAIADVLSIACLAAGMPVQHGVCWEPCYPSLQMKSSRELSTVPAKRKPRMASQVSGRRARTTCRWAFTQSPSREVKEPCRATSSCSSSMRRLIIRSALAGATMNPICDALRRPWPPQTRPPFTAANAPCLDLHFADRTAPIDLPDEISESHGFSPPSCPASPFRLGASGLALLLCFLPHLIPLLHAQPLRC